MLNKQAAFELFIEISARRASVALCVENFTQMSAFLSRSVWVVNGFKLGIVEGWQIKLVLSETLSSGKYLYTCQ